MINQRLLVSVMYLFMFENTSLYMTSHHDIIMKSAIYTAIIYILLFSFDK